MSIKTNAKFIADEFHRNAEKVGPRIQMAMGTGMQEFSSKIVREQMRGRPGLKVQTGNLINSWFLKQIGKGKNYVIRLATRTKYARIHQYGGIINHPGGTAYRPGALAGQPWVWVPNKDPLSNHLPRTKPHPIPIPKRLWVLEDFVMSGPEIFIRHMTRQIIAMKQGMRKK